MGRGPQYLWKRVKYIFHRPCKLNLEWQISRIIFGSNLCLLFLKMILNYRHFPAKHKWPFQCSLFCDCWDLFCKVVHLNKFIGYSFSFHVQIALTLQQTIISQYLSQIPNLRKEKSLWAAWKISRSCDYVANVANFAFAKKIIRLWLSRTVQKHNYSLRALSCQVVHS